MINRLTMDINSTQHNVTFSLNDITFCKYSTKESFEDIRENVIEELCSQFPTLSVLDARVIWSKLEVEKNG